MIQTYTGPYVVDPTESGRTIPTARRTLRQNVFVSPIPPKYVGSGVRRQGATIIAPSEREQTAVPKDTYTTGDVKVKAIPSDYIGSGVPALGATAYTPTKTGPQTIEAGKYLTGDQTIGAIPASYYDMTGDMAWLGADATLVHEITPITVALKDTDFNTWSPSTTAATVVASQTLSTASQKYVATDLLADDGYNYVHIWNMKMPIVYTGTPTQKALPVFSCGLLIQAIFNRYSSYANLHIGNLNNNVTAQTTLASFLRYYGTTTGTLTYTNSASYGFYYANVAPTFSSTTATSPTITLKTPTMSARCSTTYMSTANAGLVDKTNTKLTYTCKVYRVKKTFYLQGFYKYLAARVAEMDS